MRYIDCYPFYAYYEYPLTPMAIDNQFSRVLASPKTRSLHTSLFGASSNVASTSLMSTLVLPHHLFLGLPDCLLPSYGKRTIVLKASLLSSISCRSVHSSSYKREVFPPHYSSSFYVLSYCR